MQLLPRFHAAFPLLAVIALAFGATQPATAAAPDAAPYRVNRVMQVGGEGRWDFVAVDAAGARLYVPRQSHTQILRTDTGAVVADLKDTPGVHGVALVPDAGRGFTTNGKGNSLTVFDLKTNEVIGSIKAGTNPDAILYDPASKRVLCFNGKSNDATVIDPAAAPEKAAVATIALDGKPEVAVSDGAGRVYINLEDKSSVAVIDTNTMKVTDTWKIEGGESPSGLAIDVAHHRLFAGCENQVLAVIDTQSGKTLATVPIGKGVDGCAFDPGTGEAFASCGGDGTLVVVKETSPGKFEVTQTLKTRPGARTITLDETTHTIYLPTAELNEPVGNARPVPKSGTFMIVVVSR